MKITIEIPEKVLQMIVDILKEDDIVITVDELKANPKLEGIIQSDLETMYFEPFADGIDAINWADELGLEEE